MTGSDLPRPLTLELGTLTGADIYASWSATGVGDEVVNSEITADGRWSVTGSTGVHIISSLLADGRLTADGHGEADISGSRYWITGWSATGFGNLVLGSIKLDPGDQMWFNYGSSLIPPMQLGGFTYNTQTSVATDLQIGNMVRRSGLEIGRILANQPKPISLRQMQPPYVPVESVIWAGQSNITPISDSLTMTYGSQTSHGHSISIGRMVVKSVVVPAIIQARVTQVANETLVGGNVAKVRASQIVVEMLKFSASSSVRTSQVAVEALKLSNFGAIKQEAVEALGYSPSRLLLKQEAIEVLSGAVTDARVTQTVNEILAGGDAGQVRATQIAVEMLRLRTEPSLAQDRIKQAAVEMASTGIPAALIEMVIAEAVNNGAPNALIEMVIAEAVNNGAPNALIEMAATEVLHSGYPQNHLRQLAVEMLIRPEFDGTAGGIANNPRFHI